MKKIKSIKQLKAEKLRIEKQQQELQGKMRSNWNDLKESLKPSSIANGALNEFLQNQAIKNLSGGSVFKNTLAYGISMMAKRIADKTGQKLSSLFRSGKSK